MILGQLRIWARATTYAALVLKVLTKGVISLCMLWWWWWHWWWCLWKCWKCWRRQAAMTSMPPDVNPQPARIFRPRPIIQLKSISCSSLSSENAQTLPIIQFANSFCRPPIVYYSDNILAKKIAISPKRLSSFFNWAISFCQCMTRKVLRFYCG